MEILKFIVEDNEVGIRLDAYLSKKNEDKSRSFMQNLIDEEKVLVNHKIEKSKYKVKKGDEIALEMPEPVALETAPEDIDINIVYEDDDIVIINKSQGMVVHPAPGNYSGTLVNALLHHCRDLSGINGVIRPGIVHRIDKDTTGILVIAKNDNAHNKLAEQLADHSMDRTYYAIVEGVVKEDTGIVNKPIGRDPKTRVKMAIVKDGKRAVTHYEVIERFERNTLIKCNLETGRTHQIRVHMAHIGHPLVGDPVYGYKKQRFNLEGQALHAKSLGFIHPTTGKYVFFDSELPKYFVDIINKLRK